MKFLVLNNVLSLVARNNALLVLHGLIDPLQHGFCTPCIQTHTLALESPICATVMQLHTVHWIVSTPGGSKSVIV
jgi:hypothetical protein